MTQIINRNNNNNRNNDNSRNDDENKKNNDKNYNNDNNNNIFLVLSLLSPAGTMLGAPCHVGNVLFPHPGLTIKHFIKLTIKHFIKLTIIIKKTFPWFY